MESLSSASTGGHVRDFFGFADSGERFVRIAKLAARAADKDAETRENLAFIRNWLAQPRTGHSPQQIREELFPVLYLRAQEGIRAAKVSAPKDLKEHAEQAKKMLASVEEDFADQLLAETTSRLSTSNSFAQKVELARSEIAEITPSLEEVASDLIPKLRAAEASGPQTADVTAASVSCTINGNNAPCWLVVGIIIAVIVLK
jgi:hypothetical protein